MSLTEKVIRAAIIALAAATVVCARNDPDTATQNAEKYTHTAETRQERVREPAAISPDAGVSRIAPETTAEPEPEEIAVPQLQSLGTFKLTAYCPCPKCCGDWADGITYTGTVATPGRTIAVDPNVIELGSTVTIDGQDYTAEDIGGAIDGNHIDVYFDDHADALEFGVQYAEILLNTN